MHYVSRINTTVIILLCWIAIKPTVVNSSGFLFDSEVERTVECSQDPDKTIEIADPITQEELEEDLRTPTSLRYQIQKNLQLSQAYHTINQDLLREPILCVGTGREQNALPRYHVTKTLVRTIDTTMDRIREIGPDILILDAFFLTGELSHIPERTYGMVFFAHVGNQFVPIDQREQFLNTLKAYHDVLMPGGVFLINSEVHQDQQKTIETILNIYKLYDFDQLKKRIIELFHDAGFDSVEILIKDEPEIYAQNACSFLILAKKQGQ